MSSSQPAPATAAFNHPFFGLLAPGLGWVPPLRYLLRRRRILRLLGIARELGDVVEVGCGAGSLLCELSRAAHSAVGIETSPCALEIARGLASCVGGPVRFVDVPDDGWRGQKDLVCAFDVLEHIEDDDAALGGWKGWLKKEGRLCLSVPAHRSRWGAGDEWAGHWRRYDRADLLALLRRHDLYVEHIECYGFPLANLTEWVGEKTYRRLLLKRGAGISPAEATAQSGVERNDYLRLFRGMDTVPGRMVLRIAFLAQSVTSRFDWGSGYLVLARRR